MEPQSAVSNEAGEDRVLSVVIPVRNQPETLDWLLGNLHRQPVPDGWELDIVCVDDGSTDDTPAVLERYPVKVLRGGGDGPSVARNRGAAASRGELIWFIDADACPASDDFFARVIRSAEARGDFAGIGGPILLPPFQRRNPIAWADHMACWNIWPAHRPTGESGFQPTSIVMRRSVFTAAGGYDENLRVLEDWDLQKRAAEVAVEGTAPASPRTLWFDQTLGVFHSARSSLWRTLKHSWYWGLPSRQAWTDTEDVAFRWQDHRWLKWLELPRVFWYRFKVPARVSWQHSKLMSVLSLPFLAATILVWAAAYLVDAGQPDAKDSVPI